MSSLYPRIATVLEPAVYQTVKTLAKNEGVSLSKKARDLILRSLELFEDKALEQMVGVRRKDKSPSLSPRELKRKLGIDE